VELLPETLRSVKRNPSREKEKEYLEQQLSTTVSEAFLEQSGQSPEAYEIELHERAEKNVKKQSDPRGLSRIRRESRSVKTDVERRCVLSCFSRKEYPSRNSVASCTEKNQQALAALVHNVRMQKASPISPPA
jgi:hypothetical protein